MPARSLAAHLVPAPRVLHAEAGRFRLARRDVAVSIPGGADHEACRSVLREALGLLGARGRAAQSAAAANAFVIGRGAEAPPLPTEGIADQAYALRIGPDGIAARAASPAGLLYAATTLRQIARLTEDGSLPCLSIQYSPDMRMRGLYIEGGQERFGRIVAKDYLLEQIRRLAEFRMNALVVECYNLFPYASFPACADAGTLSREETAEVVAEARRWHVTLVPSLQTLAQAYELVWANEAGAPYREATAPGLICPSNPDVYPFIKGLYRDLLTWFGDSPLLGIGCSEIDMQWQARFCPRCKAHIAKGETVRDLLLGHAERCIRAVGELAAEMGRPVRPLMWGDEFYMYGPGRDWVGIERIPKSVVMGFWKYWPDYAGIGGLMDRGYDVFGISAIYNHCFYLADLSPEDPPKSWPSMEQTGTRNIDGMARDAAAAARAHPGREFLGIATASFSKHRLRAFDTLWYGFALNGLCTWGTPERGLAAYQPDFTRAFVRHYYGVRAAAAAESLASTLERLDRCKSRLEQANQALHDVVGVDDTQEAGYQGNTLMGAWRRCAELSGGESTRATPGSLRASAEAAVRECDEALGALEALRPHAARRPELADLRLAARKIRSHAERQILLVDARAFVGRAPSLPLDEARARAASEARRWRAHRAEVADILRRVSPLYSQGDPCGFASLLGDVTAIRDHLERLAAQGPPAAPAGAGRVLLEERFDRLDPGRWEVLGSPTLAGGRLETRAPGGWGHLCGLLTRAPYDLRAGAPLVVEYELTPVQLGVDSQLFAAAVRPDDISFRFALASSGGRFSIHTQSSVRLPGLWVDTGAGWRQRAVSPELKTGAVYRVRAEITRRTFRVVVRRPDEGPWEMPFWDTGRVPMDDLAATRLMFADVEPEGSAGASVWGPITLSRPAR